MTGPPGGGSGGVDARQRRFAWPPVLLLALCLGLAGVAVFLWLGRWVASGAAAPVQANVIVALGGDYDHRTTQAAQLYRAGYAPFVMLTAVEVAPPQARTDHPETHPETHPDWRVNVLSGAGVPAENLVLDSTATTSFEEATATLALMQARGWLTALVVSEPPHMRRLDWVWGKVFAGSGKRYILVATEPPWWDADRWWLNHDSRQFVLNELSKLAYYFIKY